MEEIFDKIPSMEVEDVQKDSKAIGDYLSNSQAPKYYSFDEDEDDYHYIIGKKKTISPTVLVILYCLFCILSLLFFFSLYDVCKILVVCTVMYIAQLAFLVDFIETPLV